MPKRATWRIPAILLRRPPALPHVLAARDVRTEPAAAYFPGMQRLPLLALASVLTVAAACGASTEAPNHDAPLVDAAPPPPPEDDAATPRDPNACALGVSVTREAFTEASVTVLRAAFGTSDGFTGGQIRYGEMWVSLSDSTCPLADWSALSYVVPVDPSLVPEELRATHGHVALFWSLNGRRDIAFLTSAETAWNEGLLPSNVTATVKTGTSPAAITSLLADVRAAHPTVSATYLDAIEIVSLETTLGDFVDPTAPRGSVTEIVAAAEMLRTSELFDTLTWSGLSFRIPNEAWAQVAVEGAVIEPECLRAETRAQRDDDHFTTRPSLAAPLGAGPRENPNACR